MGVLRHDYPAPYRRAHEDLPTVEKVLLSFSDPVLVET